MFVKRISQIFRWRSKTNIDRIDCHTHQNGPQENWKEERSNFHGVFELSKNIDLTIRGGSRKKMAKKITPSVPTNKKV